MLFSPVSICRLEAFSCALTPKLLTHYEGAPMHLDIRLVLAKIAEPLDGDVTIDRDWLSGHVAILREDRVRIDADLWA